MARIFEHQGKQLLRKAGVRIPHGEVAASPAEVREVTGRTRSNKPVNVEGDVSWVGTLIPVQIVTAYPHSLRGKVVPSHEFGSQS